MLLVRLIGKNLNLKLDETEISENENNGNGIHFIWVVNWCPMQMCCLILTPRIVCQNPILWFNIIIGTFGWVNILAKPTKILEAKRQVVTTTKTLPVSFVHASPP